MKKTENNAGPALYRPSTGAKIYYLVGTLIILALWPVGWLWGKWERLKRYD